LLLFFGYYYCRRGHFEAPPYNDNSKISVYHVREYEVFKLAHLRDPVDIVISHDWPRGIYHHGDMARLIRNKPFFREVSGMDEIKEGGSKDAYTWWW